MQRKLPYPGGSAGDKHPSSSQDTSYFGPVPVTPRLGWSLGVNTLLPHSISPAASNPNTNTSADCTPHLEPAQRNNESKEQGFGKRSECQENR